MSESLAVPFAITPQGHAATVARNSDTDIEQLIGAALLTHPGERALHPEFGCPDPRFASVSRGHLQAQCARYGPAIDVRAITSTPSPTRPGLTEVVVGWERT